MQRFMGIHIGAAKTLNHDLITYFGRLKTMTLSTHRLIFFWIPTENVMQAQSTNLTTTMTTTTQQKKNSKNSVSPYLPWLKIEIIQSSDYFDWMNLTKSHSLGDREFGQSRFYGSRHMILIRALCMHVAQAVNSNGSSQSASSYCRCL